MSFQSLDDILQSLQQNPHWQELRQYRQILQHWTTVVNPETALNTRPLGVNREVLWVATSSSPWAQNLSLQRHSLLKKLNKFLENPLQDIRFAPAKWHQSRPHRDDGFPEANFKAHPSYTSENLDYSLTLNPDTDLNTAFEYWQQQIEKRSQILPLCPRCHAPTPPGELKRWSVCAYCFAKKDYNKSIQW